MARDGASRGGAGLLDAAPCRPLHRSRSRARSDKPSGAVDRRRPCDGGRGRGDHDASRRLSSLLRRLPRARRAGQGARDARPAVRRADRGRTRSRMVGRGVRGDGHSVRAGRRSYRRDCVRSSTCSASAQPTARSKLDQGGVFAQGFEAVPKPLQPGGLPIMIGGGSRRVLQLAGAEADIVSLNFDNSSGRVGVDGVGSSTAERTAAKLAWVREGAGERFDQLELEIGAYFVAVTERSRRRSAPTQRHVRPPAGRAGTAPTRARRFGRCDLRRVRAPQGGVRDQLRDRRGISRRRLRPCRLTARIARREGGCGCSIETSTVTLAKRMLALHEAGTTEQADDVYRVPTAHYIDGRPLAARDGSHLPASAVAARAHLRAARAQLVQGHGCARRPGPHHSWARRPSACLRQRLSAPRFDRRAGRLRRGAPVHLPLPRLGVRPSRQPERDVRQRDLRGDRPCAARPHSARRATSGPASCSSP